MEYNSCKSSNTGGGEEEVGASGAAILRFGVFELDLKGGQLRKAGVLLRLQPQPFKVLALLASHAGEVVTREEIQQQIWGNDTFVDFERGLNFCIKQIRATLGDDAETPRYIETLPRRGYRLIASVNRLSGASPGPVPAEGGKHRRWRGKRRQTVGMAALALAVVLTIAGYFGWQSFRPPVQPLEGKIMLAVLPFDNLSGDPDQDYFSDGMTEEMITQLGRLNPERLGVIGRTSIARYKGTNKSIEEIGRELKVEYLLEGSVRREADRARISVQLIQVSDQTQLWAASYDRPLGGVLTLQIEVAEAVAREIQLKLTPQQQARLDSPPWVNPEAHDAYLKGRFRWNMRTPDSLQRSIELFDEAIAKDPEYALAYAGLADAYGLLSSTPYDTVPPREGKPRAIAAAMRALALDDTIAEAHTALARDKWYYEWDWAAAEREFQRAIELNPGYATARQWYAEYLWVTARPEEALTQIQQALELDPFSLIMHLALGRHFYLTRQYDQAISQFQETIEMNPNFFLGHFDLGFVYVQVGRYEDAISEFQQAIRLYPGSPVCVGGLGYAYARAGQDREARQTLAQLRQLSEQRYVPALYLAAIYAGLGEMDRAFGWLEKAYGERSNYLVYLNLEPPFDPLRSDPRFQALLRRMNFPE